MTSTVRRLGVTAADDGIWGSLVADEDFFQLPSWQRVQRRIVAPGAELQRWVALDASGDAVAGLATAPATEQSPWLLARPDTVLSSALEEGLDGAAAVAAALDGRALLPGVVAGGRHVGRTRPVGPAARDAAVLGELLDAVEQDAWSGDARCVCLPHVDLGGDGEPGDQDLAGVVRGRGYLEHDSGGYSWLPVPAGGFEEYMAGLSQHRRRHVRVARRALDEAGVTLHLDALASLPLDVLGAQEAALQHKYGNPADDATSTRLLELIAEEIGDDALVSYAEQDGRILGFGLVLRAGDQWFGHRAGFDYEAQGDLPLYETVLYYAVLEQAAVQGAAALHAGLGSDGAKRSLRCSTSRQRSFVLPAPGSDVLPAPGSDVR